jgi:antitoxin HigA-1
MAKARRLRNIHSGEILKEEFLKPMGITPYRLSKEIQVPLTRIAAVLKGRRAISADTALRLSRFFNTSAKFWLGLQADFDVEESSRQQARALEKIRPWTQRLVQ